MADEELLPPMTFEENPQEDITTEPEVQPATPEPEPKVETHVPLAALQEVRAENKTLKERLGELDQIKAMLAAQAQQSAPKPPDMFAEPEAYQAFIAQQVSMQVSNVTAEMSERFAREKNGDDAVNAAFEAAQAAGVIDQFKGRKDPWGDLVKWNKAQSAIKEIGDDPAAYAARIRDQIKAELQAEMVAQSVKQSAQQAAPSLAGQTNLGNRAAPAWGGPTPLSEILNGR